MIVGQEVKTADGDLICLFLERSLPPLRPAVETIAAAREQGALVGIPHPFDRYRNSILREARLASIVPLVDWIETCNARVVGRNGNEQAALFALEHGLPGVAVSDAHSTLEVGVAYNGVRGADPSTADGLRTALAGHDLVTGRASYFVRALTPIAKGVNRARGNGRARGGGSTMTPDRPTDQPSEPREDHRPMAPAATEPVSSRDMEIAAPAPGAGGSEADINPDQMSLGRRLRQPRTILSLVLPIVLLSSSRGACPASTWPSCRPRSWPRIRSC